MSFKNYVGFLAWRTVRTYLIKAETTKVRVRTRDDFHVVAGVTA